MENIRAALNLFEELHEAFQAHDEDKKKEKRAQLRDLTPQLTAAEWESYLECTAALMDRWESERNIQSKIQKIERNSAL